MNSCPSRETLQQLLASQLQEAERCSVSDHLAQCPTCQRHADELTNNDQLDKLRGQSSEVSERTNSLNSLRERLYAMAVEPSSQSSARRQIVGEHPQILGRYQIRETLGAGAFGVVYRAEDTQLRRAVALKLPRLATMAEPHNRSRFLHEARAVAGLRHPQIVALYDAGEVDGVCYLASAYTPGLTLGSWIAEQKTLIDPDQAAQIVWALADAVQHAHENGVLHRDIKPQNVLLDPTVGFHGLPFSPKLTDFGVAKLMDADGNQTLTGQLLGTPRYMAPEVAAGKRTELGPALDIYSLGVVLYELLTGRAPIEGESHAETLRRLVTDDPTPPRRSRSDVPRDLEAVCLKCLEKKPILRYQTAEQLSEELHRYLHREPTLVRPIGSLERLMRWTRRRPAVASLLAVVLAAVILAVAALAIHTRQLDSANSRMATALEVAERAQARAESSETRTKRLLYVADMRLAGRAWWDGDFRELNDLLVRQVPRDPKDDLRGFEWRLLRNITHVESQLMASLESDIYYLTVSPDGRRLASAGRDATVRIYNVASKSLVQSIATKQGEVNGLAFSPDSLRLASAGDNGSIRVWNLDNPTEFLNIAAHPQLAFQVGFTPDGSMLISCGSDPTIRMWDANSGAALGQLEGQGKQEALAVSPDGRFLASAEKGAVRVWEIAERRQLHELRTDEEPRSFMSVVFSADSRFILIGGQDQRVTVWSTETGQLVAHGRHLDTIHAIARSPAGKRFASSDGAGVICAWETPKSLASSVTHSEPVELRCVGQWQAHSTRINSVVFSSDDQLVTAGSDGKMQVWPIPSAAGVSSVVVGKMGQPVFTYDHRLMVIEDGNGIISWDLKSDPQLELGSRQATDFACMMIDRRGKLLATCSRMGAIEVWDLTQMSGESPLIGTRVRTWSLGSGMVPHSVNFSPDERTVAVLTGSPQRGLHLFDVQTGMERKSLSLAGGAGDYFAFSSDGKQMASRLDDELLLWPVASMATVELTLERLAGLVRIPRSHSSFVSLAFSPDELLLATGGSDRLIKLWDAQHGSLLATLSGHRGTVESLTFTPDGRSLVSAGAEGCVKVWSVSAREELFDIHRDKAFKPFQMVFSGNGRWLVCCPLGVGRIWLCDLSASAAR